MVGVPRSKRCQRCKRIKTKCDEKWPTCTPCVRAKVPCSGPSTLTKFIHNGHHAESKVNGAEVGVLTPNKPSGGLEKIRYQSLPDGALFGHFRLSSGEPRRNLTSVADRVAARLVGYLGNEDAAWDMLVSTGYTKHLPVRLGESAALRDCVALMCSAWANYRRNMPVTDVVDPTLYGKALRSLQRAIDDPRQQLSCETLAAATILERLEVLFDTGRPYYWTRHTYGIENLMIKRGPPKPEDHLDVQLALENHAALLSHWIVNGRQNFFLTSPWKEAMWQIQPRLRDSVSSERMNGYSIGYYFGFWPSLVHEIQHIASDPDINSQQTQATELRNRVANLEEEVKSIGDPITQDALDMNRITEQPDSESPIGKKFRFESLELMSFFLSYTMIRTVFNRILLHLTAILGDLNTRLEMEHRDFCRQTWMCIPFIRDLGMIACTFFVLPLYLSYEGASEIERDYLLDFVIWVGKYRGRLPGDRKEVELLVLKTARATTGRTQFDRTTNPS